MTKAELIKAWQEATGLGEETEELYLRLMDIMAAELLGGGEVPLQGVGELMRGREKGAPVILFLFDKDFGDSFDDHFFVE